MKVAIIGAGNIGGNVARRIVRAGHEVRIAATDAAGVDALVAELGDRATRATSRDAVALSDLVWLAVPWPAVETALEQAGAPAAFAGKVVVDATNPYTGHFEVAHLPEASSRIVAGKLGGGARVVKAINTLQAHLIIDGARPAGSADRIALPIAGDDAEAKAIVSRLLDDMGFDTVDTGSLDASTRQEPEQPLYDQALTRPELERQLADLEG